MADSLSLSKGTLAVLALKALPWTPMSRYADTVTGILTRAAGPA